MKEIKLGDIAVSITDGKHGDCENVERSGFYFVSCKDIHDGIIDYTNARQITQRDFEDTHRRTKLEPNDILITNSGTIGRMALVKEQEETKHTTFQKSVAIVKPDKEQVLPRYLYYALLNCVKEFINRSNGSAQKNLLLGTMRNFTFNIHEDFEDQERIAAILSAYDDLIENNKQQIKLLEEMAQRLYKEWFVDLHFPGYEDVPVVDSVPKGWRKLPLSEIADVVMGQSPKSEFYNDNHEGLPFHQGVGTYGRRFVVDSTYSSSLTKIAEAGSILFSVRAPVGRLNFTKNKIVIGRGLAGMKEKDGHQSFLFYMLKERFFKDDLVGNGSIFASISKNELLDQMFVVPTDGLKCLFDNYVHSIDEKINALDSQITRLTEARDRLLPKLMSGEIKI